MELPILSNWYVVMGPGQRQCVCGFVTNMDSMINNRVITTHPIVSLNRELNILQTTRETFKLGKPAKKELLNV